VTDHLDEEALNLHFDGELPPDRAAAAKRHLETCAECGKRLHALERLHEMVVLSAHAGAEGIDFDRVFSQVERGVRAQPPLPFFERMKTLVQELIEHRPLQVFLPATGALAAAAWLILSTTAAPGPNASGATAEQGTEQAARRERDQGVERERMMLAEKLESEVVQVDFGENSGTVFEIALADGASTPVVWINDEE